MRRRACVLVALLCASCGGNHSPIAPTQAAANITGTWTGIGNSRVFPSSFTVRVTFAQNGSALTGTWSTQATPGTSSGSLIGSINGTGLSAALAPSDPRLCGYSVTMVLSANTMMGDYAATNCTFSENGSMTLSKN